jgi:hypothetical protein
MDLRRPYGSEIPSISVTIPLDKIVRMFVEWKDGNDGHSKERSG